MRLGEWNINALSINCSYDTTCTSPIAEISIKTFWTRFDYNRPLVDDIGVIELVKDVTFTSKFGCLKTTIQQSKMVFVFLEWIQPICLPNFTTRKDRKIDEIFVSYKREFNRIDSKGF